MNRIKKNLVLLTSSYPFYIEELFLNEEVEILSKRFEKIIVFCFHQNQTKMLRKIPSNVVVYPFFINPSLTQKILTFTKSFFFDIVGEILNIIFNYKQIPTLMHLKMISQYKVISKMQKKIILDNLINAKIKIEDCIFYSYWNNFMALTLSEIKTKNKNVICISKSHGWDIDYMRHNPKYLPFKGKILNKLDVTFTISSVGKKMMTNLFPNLPEHKIKVSYLGTKNSRPPLIKKTIQNLLFAVAV